MSRVGVSVCVHTAAFATASYREFPIQDRSDIVSFLQTTRVGAVDPRLSVLLRVLSLSPSLQKTRDLYQTPAPGKLSVLVDPFSHGASSNGSHALSSLYATLYDLVVVICRQEELVVENICMSSLHRCMYSSGELRAFLTLADTTDVRIQPTQLRRDALRPIPDGAIVRVPDKFGATAYKMMGRVPVQIGGPAASVFVMMVALLSHHPRFKETPSIDPMVLFGVLKQATVPKIHCRGCLVEGLVVSPADKISSLRGRYKVRCTVELPNGEEVSRFDDVTAIGDYYFSHATIYFPFFGPEKRKRGGE